MSQRTGNNGNNGLDEPEQHIVDFNEAREQKLQEKRRKTERIFFKHLLSVYSVVSDGKMLPIELVDVSEEGCSFQTPFDENKPWPRDVKQEVPLRLYFSQDTFLEIRVHINNSRPYIENSGRYTRYGCAIDTTTKSYPAYQQFVRFLKQYAEHAHKDMGDVTVFYL
ncbi:MAG: PilZ domain-containing protein [Bdellovibrionota bacterium]